jgi:SpoVK/Ycf46/Vps4 family AAA+-type ATPase
MSDDQGQKKDTKVPEAKEHYLKAGEYFEENKFDESIESYTLAIKADPTYASAYFNRALAYAIINKYDEATRDVERVMMMEPDSYDAPYVMGIVCEYQQDFNGAKEWYEKALKMNPNYEQAKARLDLLSTKLNSYSDNNQQSSPSNYQKAMQSSTEISKSDTTTVMQEGQIKKAEWFKSNMSFKDVVGFEPEKKLIYENIILAIKKPELLKAYGKKLGLGVIFFGPPGCGKTYFVKAIAGETNSNVIIAHINEIVDMYAGNTEKNMHAIFEQARKNTPCIIFFDEVDALGTKRDGGGGGDSGGMMKMAVNQFLTELDGVEKNPEGIFVIGATNQPWDMDPALKRAGRFGESIYIPPPDYQARKEAFKFNTRKMPLKGINFGRLARATSGFSNADLAEISDKAALIPAAEEDRTGKKRPITMNDFMKMIKTHGNTLDEWYTMISKEIISKKDVQIVDGKRTEVVKEGKLSPEEKSRYKPLIKDVKRNNNPIFKFVKKFMRYWAWYIF